jgi:Winged helix-turn-helix DNA-binding
MSLVDQVRKLEHEVVERLRELEPLTREYDQLRKVAQRLGLKYTPGSAKPDDGAKPSATRRRTAKPAAKRAARKPAKVQAVQSRGRSAAKPSAKPRGTRSTTAPKAKAKATGGAKTATRARPRKRAAASRQRSGGRRAAARPGQRHEDVLRLVGENPGITVREIGERLGVDATGLYRVVNQLTDEGRVRKDGTGLKPVDTTTTSEPKPAATTDTAKQAPPAADTEAPAKEPEPSTAVAASAPSDDS